MDCSPPGSAVHGIFQARVLEWGAIAFSNNGDYLSHYLELAHSTETLSKPLVTQQMSAKTDMRPLISRLVHKFIPNLYSQYFLEDFLVTYNTIH